MKDNREYRSTFFGFMVPTFWAELLDDWMFFVALGIGCFALAAL